MSAPQLSEAEQRFLDRPDAPESIRERLAAALADEDQQALLHGPMTWEQTQLTMPEGARYYRRLADRALTVLAESALR